MQEKINIGIGITVRNRPKLMRYTVPHWLRNLPHPAWSRKSGVHTWRDVRLNVHIVMSDDASNYEDVKEYENQFCRFDAANVSSLHFIANKQRLGIAKNKNKCIEKLYEHNCDYYFLFDEDCYPRQLEWEKLYIKAHERTKIHHMIFNTDGLAGIRRGKVILDSVQEWTNCTGVMLFFTKTLLETIGGFDPVFNIYGYEHANFSLRSHAAGMHNGYGEYTVPLKAEEFIESIDFANHPGKPPHPVLVNKQEYDFKSSIHGENTKEYISENSEHLCPKHGDYYRDFRTASKIS